MAILLRTLAVLLGLLAMAYAGWRLLPDHALEQIEVWTEPWTGDEDSAGASAERVPRADGQDPAAGAQLFARDQDDGGTDELDSVLPAPDPLNELKDWRRLPKVLLDPGHGGADPGNPVADRFEKELVLDLSLRVARLLRESGIPVEMTRTEDVTLSLDARVAATLHHHDSMLVSLHMNGHTEQAYHGVETFWYEDQAEEMPEPQRSLLRQRSQRLGQLVQTHLVKVLADVDDRGLKQRNLKMVREPRLPAILVECGFLSNPVEGKRLLSVDYREKVARGVAAGVEAAWEEKLMQSPDLAGGAASGQAGR